MKDINGCNEEQFLKNISTTTDEVLRKMSQRMLKRSIYTRILNNTLSGLLAKYYC